LDDLSPGTSLRLRTASSRQEGSRQSNLTSSGGRKYVVSDVLDAGYWQKSEVEVRGPRGDSVPEEIIGKVCIFYGALNRVTDIVCRRSRERLQ
jgi:hypothetical protein